MNTELLAAAQGAVPPPGSNISPAKRLEWNNFLDYLEKKGYAGNTLLDDRDKGLGAKLIVQYKKENPNVTLTYDDVKPIQQEFQDIRKQFVDDYNTGKVKVEGVKSADELMAGLSPVDGWLGSQTTSHRFPVAKMNKTDLDGNKSVVDYKTDMAAHAAAIAKYKH